MNSFDPRAIFAAVKANLARLDGCALPHDFVNLQPETRPFLKRQVCTKCGGEVECGAGRWYRQGLEDAKRAGG